MLCPITLPITNTSSQLFFFLCFLAGGLSPHEQRRSHITSAIPLDMSCKSMAAAAESARATLSRVTRMSKRQSNIVHENGREDGDDDEAAAREGESHLTTGCLLFFGDTPPSLAHFTQ